MLNIVATPIGNLSEISPRTTEILSTADLILCEDTRRTLGLLSYLDIKKPVRSYHKFNEKTTVDGILSELKSGKNIALVSDAGMPCISDPGAILVRACREEGIKVNVISGPCAAVNAVAMSGFEGDFAFLGFLPDNNKVRTAKLKLYSNLPLRLVVYSPPHGLKRDLSDLYSSLGSRRAVLTRELTKYHEEAVDIVLGNELDKEPRGEYCIVIEGGEAPQAPELELSIEEHLDKLLALGVPPKDAIKQVASTRNLDKNIVYQLDLKRRKP